MINPIGPCPARIMIVGEFPSERDIVERTPFSGSSSKELSTMLSEAGMQRSGCFATLVLRVRPPGNDIGEFVAERKSDITANHIRYRDKWVLPAVVDGIKQLTEEINLCQPNVIIAFGNFAMWALTGKSGITSWRGSVLESDLPLAIGRPVKVVPVYSPGMVFKNWSWRGVAVHDLKRAAKESKYPEVLRPDYNFVIRPDYGTAMAILSQILHRLYQGPLKLSQDIETRAGHIACIGIAWSKTEALCIPLMCVERPEGYWSLDEEADIMWMLYRVLTHPNVRGVGQNYLYDEQYFNRHLCYQPSLETDTMIAQHTLFSAMEKGLHFLSSMYCEHHEYWKDEGKEWDPKKHDEDQYWAYNCKDAVITYEVAEGQANARAALAPSWPKLSDVHAFQQKLFWPVLETMNRGVRVDTKRRATFAMELMEEIAKREQWLNDVFDQPVNIKSPLQMKELFYGQLNLKEIRNRKTGAPSCDDEALRKLAEREPLLRPIYRKISELRSLGVFLSTFVNAPLDIDGRLRCSFNIAGTETYRFASKKNAFGSGLNMQNIPKGGDTGEDLDALELPNVRSLFIPDPGQTFFDIDLDSADLRVVTWEANVKEMKAMLAEGKKVYVEVMKEYFKDPSMTKHSRHYSTFKGLCHGTNYLGTPKGLAERMGLLVHEVEKVQKWYFGKFPEIKRWHDELKDQVFKRRMIENVFGYRYFFFDRLEGNVMNEAVAWIPQSTVGCLINRAYVNIYENHKDIQVLLQVHDSLAGQFPSHLGQSALDRIVASTSIPLPYPDDPLIIPVGVKSSTVSWGDCED